MARSVAWAGWAQRETRARLERKTRACCHGVYFAQTTPQHSSRSRARAVGTERPPRRAVGACRDCRLAGSLSPAQDRVPSREQAGCHEAERTPRHRCARREATRAVVWHLAGHLAVLIVVWHILVDRINIFHVIRCWLGFWRRLYGRLLGGLNRSLRSYRRQVFRRILVVANIRVAGNAYDSAARRSDGAVQSIGIARLVTQMLLSRRLRLKVQAVLVVLSGYRGGVQRE